MLEFSGIAIKDEICHLCMNSKRKEIYTKINEVLNKEFNLKLQGPEFLKYDNDNPILIRAKEIWDSYKKPNVCFNGKTVICKEHLEEALGMLRNSLRLNVKQ